MRDPKALKLAEILDRFHRTIQHGGRARLIEVNKGTTACNPYPKTSIDFEAWQYGYEHSVAYEDLEGALREMRMKGWPLTPIYERYTPGGVIKIDAETARFFNVKHCGSVSKDARSCKYLAGHPGPHAAVIDHFGQGMYSEIHWTTEEQSVDSGKSRCQSRNEHGDQCEKELWHEGRHFVTGYEPSWSPRPFAHTDGYRHFEDPRANLPPLGSWREVYQCNFPTEQCESISSTEERCTRVKGHGGYHEYKGPLRNGWGTRAWPDPPSSTIREYPESG